MKKLLPVLLLLAPLLASAAFNGVLLTSTPENPQPNQRVTITATPTSADVAGSEFVWTVGGTKVLDELGANTLTLTAPASGKQTVVAVSILSGGQLVASASQTLAPAKISLEWEGLGTVPPLYGGRPLFTAHTPVRIVALTDAPKAYPKELLNFTWKINGHVDSKLSGYGHSVVEVAPPLFNQPFSVSVTAASRDGGYRAEETQLFQPTPGRIVVYETTPLEGLIDGRTIEGTFPFSQSEVSFKGYTLNIAPSDSGVIAWTLNGTPVTAETGDPRIAVFKKTADGHGTYQVGISYADDADFLNRAVQQFLLNF